MSKLKLLILDVDGVMTDGTKLYDDEGEVVAKSFRDQDFTAIKRFKADGVHVHWLSGDQRVNEAIALRRKIDFTYSREKHNMLERLMAVYEVTADQVVYVGDDWYDIPISKKLEKMGGEAWCTNDANTDLVGVCSQTVPVDGGQGVVACLYDLYKAEGILCE